MPEALVSKILIAPKFRYSQLVKAGHHYHVSGMLALDNNSGELTAGGPGRETAKILENLGLLLTEFNLQWQHLAFARIYTTEFEKFAEINAAWEKVFDGSFAPPARSSIGVSALPLGAAVEIEFTLYKADIN
ncbi:MAG: RidA family protein [Pseudohongiellaceae bacterium]